MLRLSWLISLGISLLGFLIIGYFFTIQPDETASNGNLGFIGIIFVLPFLLLSLFTTFRYMLILTRGATEQLKKTIYVVGSLLLVGVLVYLSLDFKNDFIASLDGDQAVLSSNFPKLNEYTYSIYFNFYTFALIHAVVGVIAAFVGLIKSETKKEELPE